MNKIIIIHIFRSGKGGRRGAEGGNGKFLVRALQQGIPVRRCGKALRQGM